LHPPASFAPRSISTIRFSPRATLRPESRAAYRSISRGNSPPARRRDRLCAVFRGGKVIEGVKARVWDICFLAIDPVRAEQILFTPPYVLIEGAYLVRADSPIRDNAEVDRPGVRVMVSTGSAYDLYLTRTIRHATLVRTVAAKDVVDVFVEQNLDVAAGVRPALEADARRVPGLRLLPGRFMAIHQAMGTPRGRDVAAEYLRAFIEEMKASGFVAQSLARNGVEGASVAPAKS
jgi:polar amino acid transport system substrate-binding protein